MVLEQGGDNQQGQITVLVEKLKLLVGWISRPCMDTFKIQAGGAWHEFVINGMKAKMTITTPA